MSIHFVEEARKANKKIVLINANCHGTALTKFLKLCESFTDKYEIFPLPAIQLNTEKKIDKSILNEADVFIHQDIRENNSIAYELSDKVTVSQLKPSCYNLIIPNLVGFGKWLYPNLGEIIIDPIKKNNLIFRDSILDEAVKKKDTAPISFYIDFFNEYEYPKEKLDYLFERDMIKLKEREEKWDIKIFDFLINNYKTIPIYVDAGHPSKMVMYEIGKGVLESLNIKNDVMIGDYNSALGMPAPAPPKVKEYFGVKYTMPLEPRKSHIFDTSTELNEEEYVYGYIAEYMYFAYGLKLF